MRRSALPYVLAAPDGCDCPSCSGADVDPQQVIDDLLAGANLTEAQDPLESEMVGAMLLSLGTAAEGFAEALIGALIPQIEARATAEALAMLLAIGSVAADPVARLAAARLVEAGVPQPGWAAELGEPVTFANCWHLADPQGTASILACSFHRAGRTHAIVINVAEQDCGAASDILLLDTEELSEALEMIRAANRSAGLELTAEALDAREFRWQVEKALDARAVHDALDDTLIDEELDEMSISEDGPPYPALAVLVRARMTTLPTPSKPPASHGDENEGWVGLTAQEMMAQMTGAAGSAFGAQTSTTRRDRTAVAALPPPRKKSHRQAPIYQGHQAADLAAPGGPRRHQPGPAAHHHPDRVRLAGQPPAHLRNPLRQLRKRPESTRGNLGKLGTNRAGG